MNRQVEAVYENGVLRPLEPLPLREHQRVSVTVSDAPRRGEDWLDREFMARAADEISDAPSLEEVRRRLSKIPGSLTDDFIAGREER